MDESEANMSSDGNKMTPSCDKPKPKKRSLVERELETSLTARVTSPVTGRDCSSTSRYGRARRAKTDTDFCNTETAVTMELTSPKFDRTPIKSLAAYKMHASNSSGKVESSLQGQIENIYSANISLSRFASDDISAKSPSSAVKKIPKTYVKTDLIQTKEKEGTIMLIKNMFSPTKSVPNSYLSNVLESSSEKYVRYAENRYADKASIVKTLDFDSKQKSKSKEVSVVKTLDFDSRSKRKEKEITTVMTKSEVFDLEAKCEYQVGDIAWARMGTYPFWPCIVTRDPDTNMFVRKKLFGRIERNMINVTFFGDNGRRSWIVETMLRKFQGLKEFEATRDQFKPEDKKKDPRLYAALFISDKKQALWLKSVEEAETVMKEPKRLRIDLLYDLLEKSKIKQNQKSQKKVTRADSDVSLSESLLDTLFSEDDAKSDDPDRVKKRKSLDVSEVVTACLDNMAARTGLTQIQKQSHMDRWLQKAKTKTPEKSHLEITITVEEVDEAIDKSKVRTQSEKKISKDEDKSEKKSVPKPIHQKPYSLRKSTAESANLLLGHDEHDYSAKFKADNCYVKLENIPLNDKTVRTCIPVTEGKDICDKNKEYENEQKILAYGVDDQTDPEISNKMINEEILGPNNCITANANRSLLEMDVDFCINDKKSTQEAVDKTYEEYINNEEYTITNTVVSDQIKSEISNNTANEDFIETKSLVASEMDVQSNFNDKNQGVFVDNSEKINKSRELAINTTSGKNQMETAIEESIQEKNEFTKHVACHDINDQNGEIPPISVVISQTNQENVLEDLKTKNSTVKDITENKDHNDMSCVSDTSDWNIKVPLICDDDSLSHFSILEAEKKDEKVKNNRGQCEINTETIAESAKLSVTVKVEENVTEIDSVEKLTKKKDLLSNVNECLAEEPNDKFKYVTAKDALSDPNCSLLSDNPIAEKYKNQTLSDADFSKLSDNEVAEKHGNQTNEVSFQKNMSDQTFESLTENNIDEETRKKRNHSEFNVKNNSDSEINTNVTESNLKNNSESKINNDIASKINNDSVSKINNDLGSEIKSDLVFEMKKYSDSDLACKIKDIDMGSEIKKKSLESGINKSNSESNIKNNDLHFEMKKNDSESEINDDLASKIEKVFKIENNYLRAETNNDSECKIQKNDSELQIKKNYILPEINRKDLRSETKNNNSEPEKHYSKSTIEGECSVVVVPLNGPVFNGYRNKKLKDTKDAVYTDSDTASTNSEFDDLSLIELKKHTVAKTRARRDLALNKQNHNENLVDLKEINSQSPPPRIVNIFSREINLNGKADANADNDSSFVMKRILRPRIDSPVESLKPTKESSLERRIKEMDHETDSIASEDSNVSAKSQGLLKDKANEEDKMKNPEFVSYLELRQDILIDEHPELSYDEIVAYLYKTWLYESDSESKIKKNYIAPEINREKLGSETTKNNSESDKRNSKSTKEGECSVVVVPLNGSILNGYHDNRLKDTKEDVYADSDTASTNSEFDDLSLIELKKHTVAKTRARRDLALNKQNNNENSVYMKEINSQSPLPRIVNIFSREIKINEKADANADNDSSFVMKRILRPRIDTPVESLNPSKESSPERRNKAEIDSETASFTSEGSFVSAKPRGRVKDKANEKDKMKDPEFVRYLELRQDVLNDEHPELSYDEIVAYLYKTWLYEQSCKSEFVKSHDKEQSNLVKGVNPDEPQVKKMKRAKQDKNKLIDIDKVFKKELIEEFACISSKDKPKRKTSEPCYVEDFSDIEDEIKMFEICKNHKDKSKAPENIQQKDAASTSEVKEKTAISSDIKEQKIEELSPEEYYDEVQAYFEELSTPKPNIFKGLVREKICEICEKTSNLVKCTGCNGMFHIECVKKETDIVDMPVSTRSRKKKKKPRGRRPKSSIDPNGLDESHSDEKPQDVTVSEENKSVEEIQVESHIVVADVDNFEAQLAAKMKEMIEIEDKIDYDSYSSDDCLDWRHTIAGKCEIVDVQLKHKKPEIDSSNFKCNNCQKDNVPLCFVCKSPVSPKSQINHRQKCQVAHCHKFYHLECLENWPQTQFSSVDPSKNKGKVNKHSEALSCPRHVCHTCVCDDPRGCKTRFSGDKLARCVRCPATYHSFTKCLPAGTQILTASHIVCPRHYEHRPGKVPCHVNTGWCFICAQGGTLICCEYCPTSFHAECLQIDPPDEGYMCEDCETGRLPLYGEMVWVKLGHYRWWPGLVLHPYQIPPNIMAVRHSPGEFVVRFFGQYDHYWVNRGRVFPYQEGDSGRISGQKSKIDEAFTIAMEHAQRAYEILKTLEENEEESPDIASSLLPPHYVKLKTNKPYGSVIIKREVEESSLTQCDCDPHDEQPCGPMSHCLNRMLLTECGPSCRAGDRCNNRAFERREYPRLTAYRTKHRGWGLKALEDIKAGQFVIEYVGELIDEEEFRRRMRRKQEIRDENFYFLTLDKERMIDAGPKGNLARFMNHCCEPNCETQKWTVLGDIRVGLFALKDIPANSELTFNYNLECAGIDKKRCMCGAKRCSGYIGAKPKQEEKETQKKPKLPTKRPYKKRKPEEIANDKNKPKKPIGRPPKPRELTDIEKDLLIIKNATNGISSDSECSGRLSSVDADSERKDLLALKRKRVSFSSEDASDSKRLKYDEDKTSSEID